MPLHWKNDMTKGGDYPDFKTSLSSDGDRNIEKTRLWHIQ